MLLINLHKGKFVKTFEFFDHDNNIDKDIITIEFFNYIIKIDNNIISNLFRFRTIKCVDYNSNRIRYKKREIIVNEYYYCLNYFD